MVGPDLEESKLWGRGSSLGRNIQGIGSVKMPMHWGPLFQGSGHTLNFPWKLVKACI